MKKEKFDPKWKEKNLLKDPLARLTEEARQKGMSYGQYQAYLLTQSMSARRKSPKEGE